MKVKSAYIIACLIACASVSSFGQHLPGAFSYEDLAYLFGSYNLKGTARMQGLANASVSLGGDPTVVLSNPAGLGFYNRSEISLTPSVNIYNAESSYLGNKENSDKTRFNIDNFSAVFHLKPKSSGALVSNSIAFTFAKVNEFHSDISYRGSNTNNDILDFFVQEANKQNVFPDDLSPTTRNAFNSFLISEYGAEFSDRDPEFYYDRTFFTEFPSEEFPTLQSEIFRSSGSQNQWNFSYGGNIKDVFYFGATLGFTTIRHTIEKQYDELYPDGSIVLGTTLVDRLTIDGNGINGTFGVTIRPSHFLSIGASFISPTSYNFVEDYSNLVQGLYAGFPLEDYENYFFFQDPPNGIDHYAEITSGTINYLNNNNIGTNNYIGTFPPDFSSDQGKVLTNEIGEEIFSPIEYTYNTPLRFNLGATIFTGKYGFITADIEFMDYASARYKNVIEQEFTNSINENISATYTNAINYRIGAEGRIGHFRIRGGYAHFGSPIKQSMEADLSRQLFSGGLGYKSKKFFADFAVTNTSFESIYSPYVLDSPENIPAFDGNNSSLFETSNASFKVSNWNTVLTLGIHF